MIAVSRETGEGRYMGHVTAATDELVSIKPWNFLHGWIDEDRDMTLNADNFTFLWFKTEAEMDLFFANNYWDTKDGDRKTH